VGTNLSLGDVLRRGALSAIWRSDFAPDWRFSVSEDAELRQDRTFGRDLEEARISAGARLRRASADRTTLLEAGVRGEMSRSRGVGSEFLLDRDAARATLVLDRFPLHGSDWRLAYTFSVRAYPDSQSRDHREHLVEGRWHRDVGDVHSLVLEVETTRRSTVHAPTGGPAPATSRDDFWTAIGAVENDLRWGSRSWWTRVTLEGFRYDRPDSAVFFDYGLARALTGPRFGTLRWILTVGPRGEVLWSPESPAEEYREIGGFVEVEFATGGAWWTATPAAGWRDYSEVPFSDVLGASSPRSSFAFYEVSLLGDQPLAPGLRLHLLASGRYEAHVDAAHDARSLYFSLDVRKLF
jgi:hypothetical protein